MLFSGRHTPVGTPHDCCMAGSAASQQTAESEHECICFDTHHHEGKLHTGQCLHWSMPPGVRCPCQLQGRVCAAATVKSRRSVVEDDHHIIISRTARCRSCGRGSHPTSKISVQSAMRYSGACRQCVHDRKFTLERNIRIKATTGRMSESREVLYSLCKPTSHGT